MRLFTHYRFFILLLLAAAACSCGEKSTNPRSTLPEVDAIFFERSDFSLGEKYKRPHLPGYHNEDQLITLPDGNYLRTWRAEFEGTEGPTQLLFYQVVSDAGEAVSEQRAIPLVGLVVDFDLLPLSSDRWIASAVTLAHVEEPTYSINTYLLSGSGDIIDQQQSTYPGIFTSASYFQIIPSANASCVSLLAYAHAQPICIDQGDTLVAHESIAIPSLDSRTNYVWHHNGKNWAIVNSGV